MSLWTCFKLLLLLLLLPVIVLKVRVSPFLLTPHAAVKAGWQEFHDERNTATKVLSSRLLGTLLKLEGFRSVPI